MQDPDGAEPEEPKIVGNSGLVPSVSSRVEDAEQAVHGSAPYVYTRRPSVPAQRRTIIIRCLLLTAALAALTLTLASIVGALIGLIFLPLPVAWLVLRVSVRAAAAVVGVIAFASGVCGFLGGDAFHGVFFAGLVLVVAGGVGWAHSQVALGRRWQRGALTAVTVAWLIAVFVFAGLAIADRGFDGLRGAVRATVNDAYRPQLDTCNHSKEPDSAACIGFRTQHQSVIDAINNHGRLLLWPFAALLALVCAAGSLLTFRAVASRSGLPVQRAIPLRDVEAPWYVAYVLTLGLALIMLANVVDVSYDLLRVVGYTLATIGGGVMVVQAIAVTAWTLDRLHVRRSLRVLFWISTLPFWWLYGPFMLVLGLWDLSIHFRRKALNADNITRRGTDI